MRSGLNEVPDQIEKQTLTVEIGPVVENVGRCGRDQRQQSFRMGGPHLSIVFEHVGLSQKLRKRSRWRGRFEVFAPSATRIE